MSSSLKKIFLFVLSAMIILFAYVINLNQTYNNSSMEDVVKIAVINPQYESYPPWLDFENITKLIQQDIDEYCIDNSIRWNFDFMLYDLKVGTDERVKWLEEKGYNFVIGLRSTSECDKWITFQRENKIKDMLLISTGSTVAKFNGKFEGYELFFRTHTPDDSTMKVLAKYVNQLGVKNVVSIINARHENLDSMAFEDEFTRLGGNIKNIDVDLQNVDWEAIMDELSKTLYRVNGTKAVFFNVLQDPEVDIFSIIERYPNLMNVEWFMPNNIYLISGSEEILTTHSITVDRIGLYGIRPGFENDTLYQVVNQRYLNVSNKATSAGGTGLEYSEGLAYDSAWLLVASVIEADSSDPSRVADVIVKISESYTGVTGPMRMNTMGDRVEANYIFTRLGLVNGSLTQFKSGFYDCANDEITLENSLVIIGFNQFF